MEDFEYTQYQFRKRQRSNTRHLTRQRIPLELSGQSQSELSILSYRDVDSSLDQGVVNKAELYKEITAALKARDSQGTLNYLKVRPNQAGSSPQHIHRGIEWTGRYAKRPTGNTDLPSDGNGSPDHKQNISLARPNTGFSPQEDLEVGYIDKNGQQRVCIISFDGEKENAVDNFMSPKVNDPRDPFEDPALSPMSAYNQKNQSPFDLNFIESQWNKANKGPKEIKSTHMVLVKKPLSSPKNLKPISKCPKMKSNKDLTFRIQSVPSEESSNTDFENEEDLSLTAFSRRKLHSKFLSRLNSTETSEEDSQDQKIDPIKPGIAFSPHFSCSFPPEPTISSGVFPSVTKNQH